MERKYIYYPIDKWLKETSFIEIYSKFKIDETKLYSVENIEGYDIYLMEALGNANVLDKYSNLIVDYIKEFLNNNGNKKDLLVMKLIIRELGVNEIHITFTNKPTSIYKKDDILMLNIDEQMDDNLSAEIDHELQHIYINEKGNKTKQSYFICNDLIQKTTGRTKAFLTLYYLSFKDEISANIHMFHRQIGINGIKSNKQFKAFLNNHELYNIACNKMVKINDTIHGYKTGIIAEGFEDILVKEFGMDLDTILNIAGKQIMEAGEDYKRRLGKCFL